MGIPWYLQGDYVGSLKTLGALLDGKFHLLVLFQLLIPFHLKSREVDEDIFAFLATNEAEALGGIEPFNGTVRHGPLTPFYRRFDDCPPGSCPVHLPDLNVRRGAQRLINLIGAWNNQLLEILGAMGMREVRRLRGEVGRAMFKEDLDKEIFAPLFARPEGETRRVGE